MAPEPRQARGLTDPFGRTVTYVRVSVTDRCNLRCTYCMSEQMQFLPKAQLLTLEELDRVCNVFVRRGVRRLRLTGGEPLMRRGIMDLVRSLSRHLDSGDLDELTMTTNGVRLREFSAPLKAAGVRRINVSLDSLDRATFARIARSDCLDQVLDGIAAGEKVVVNGNLLMDGQAEMNRSYSSPAEMTVATNAPPTGLPALTEAQQTAVKDFLALADAITAAPHAHASNAVIGAFSHHTEGTTTTSAEA